MPFNVPIFSSNPHNSGRVRSFVADLAAALEDGRLQGHEAKELVHEHIVVGLSQAIRRKGGRLRNTRRRERRTDRVLRNGRLQNGRHVAWPAAFVGADKVKDLVGEVKTYVDIARFDSWAASALADGEISESELEDLIVAVVVPTVLRLLGLMDKLEDDPPAGQAETSQGGESAQGAAE